jgi:hypothetical protein
VRVRAVNVNGSHVFPYFWESSTLWYNPSRNDPTFLIVAPAAPGLSPSAGQIFGKPARIGHVAHCEILIYRKNLLG